MPRKRIKMKQLRKVLTFSYENQNSLREIAKLTGVSKTTINEYLVRFRRSGISYEESLRFSDTELIAAMEEKKQEESEQYTTLVALFPEYSRRLKLKGMTKQFLWEDYRRTYPDGYGYSQFCHHFGIFLESGELTMRQPHNPGDMTYMDYAGQGFPYYQNGEKRTAEIYVAVLGASQLAYVEASESQKKEDFIRSTESALRYFGGVTRALVPDNLKSAVLKADKYEPELNPLFDDFAEYYRTCIIPARAYHPKDKPLAENMVRLAYQRIFAPMYDKTFHSLAELNQAIRVHLEEHNNRKLSKLQISRRDLFNEIEKKELKILPSQFYPIKYFESHKVAPDYHIILSADKHYYSVPWQLKGKQVKVIFDDRNVAIYADNQRVAQHSRDKKMGQYTTSESHMPARHQFVHSWSAEKFQKWAQSIGQETYVLISRLLTNKRHEQQAYKSCVGVLSLAKKYGSEDLNHACRRALNYDRVSYREVKLYIEEIHRQKKVNDKDEQVLSFRNHENLRNTAIYK